MNDERLKGVWTKFGDMCSGGKDKEEWQVIYIQAPKKEAKVIFYNRFGHNPENVTCTCCGADYSIREGSIYQLTAFLCWLSCLTLKKYMEKEDSLFIFSDAIKQ